MGLGATLCVILVYLASWTHATPSFAFPISELTTTALEDWAFGRTILELLVWDLDDLASYTLPEDDIEFNDPSDQFDHRIDGNTVVITVSTSSLSFGTFSVTCRLISQDMTITVNIVVIQVNTPPIFSISHYLSIISEDHVVGDTVNSEILAHDFDLGSNGVFEYQFEDPGSAFPHFSIDTETGLVTLSQSVDYDMGDTGYTFTILARETESIARYSATAQLLIFVLNVNDNQPDFGDIILYEYSIEENTGMALHTTSNGLTTYITATDGDAGTFGVVTYTLTGGQGLFDVEQTSNGTQLKTLGDLNREAVSTYSMTLLARDGGDPSFIDSVSIEVTVEDVNDINPVFTIDEYRVSLFEEADYTSFVIFHASDGDAEPPNNEVTYITIDRTDDPSGDQPFVLDSTLGSVSVSGLDYETDQSYTLVITAQDGGTPSLTATATLYVTVLPVNELGPVFVQQLYSATVDEDHIVGETVGVIVEATDEELHGINYSIDFGFQDGSYFSVNSTSGVVTLAQSLDSDPPTGHDLFTFVVLAIDVPSEGEVPKTGTVQVEVTVTDINDNSPIITTPEQSAVNLEVIEVNAVLGQVLLTVLASDIDGDSDGDAIIYTLQANDNSLSYFEIDSTNGVLQQTAQVDREGCDPVPCHYDMTVYACDQGTTPLCSTVGVTVNVLDYNDNPPVLTNNPLTADEAVLECEIDGRMLSTVTAEDNQDDGDFAEVFFEAITDSDNHIVLNERSGVLNLGYAPVDYDAGDRSFSLTVKAVDNPDGSPSNRLTSADIFVQTITIGDCNNKAPVFTAMEYDFTIAENTVSGILTGSTINTTDDDSTTENQVVTYQITDNGNVDWFGIDGSTGAVYIEAGAVVDRENENILTDNQGNGVVVLSIGAVNVAPTATLYSAQNAQVVITITDENDNAPVMDARPLTGTETIVILEDAPISSILAVVRATDPDVGINAVIEYYIISGNDAGKFSLDATTGVLILAEVIDFEMDDLVYTLVIEAINPSPANPPPASTMDEIQLTITVENANEHAPVFEQDRYDEDIHEYNMLSSVQQHTVGDIIITVFATDADSDSIQYSITGGNEDGIFEIPNDVVGNIVLKNLTMIDYETTTSYALLITATDLVIPATDRKTDSTYVYISVIDENDNVPQFSSDTYTAIINEEEPSGTPVTLISPITASDDDSLEGLESLQYEITTVGDPQPSPFLAFTISVDGNSLTTTTPIDREEFGDVFTFQLTVTDSNGNTDTALVTVNVMDINDNPPDIHQTSDELFITIPENHPVDSVLRTITATDIDLDANADFRFTMQGGAGFFDINLETGVIKLVSSLQDLEPPMLFSLTVYAIDTGGLSDQVTFEIDLTYSNDHPPIFESIGYSGSIIECVEDGMDISPVITLRATDDDSNAVVSYYIESTSVGMQFKLDDRGGVADILTNGSGVYDREMADVIQFTVYATDGVVGTDDDSATVTITVSDCNDNHPIFTQDLYDIDVSEGTTSGTTVIQVHTNDADIGENEEVRFSVYSVDPPSLTDVFIVDPETGGIVTNVEITNQYTGTTTCSTLTEQSNNITLTIMATDQATQQPQLSNFATVFIRLLDRNSEAPTFIPTNFYSFSVAENIDNAIVGVVEAIDECDQNSVVTYVLVSGEDSNPFEIDPVTGVIRLVSALDREENSLLVVQLEAVDDGTDPGPQTGYASISINVLDENDNDPELVRGRFEMTIPENVPIGTTLITLLASDPDLDENGTLTYRIISGDTDLFMLEAPNEGSGSDHLVTIAPLDRETVSNHLVTIIVEDDGGEIMRNDTALMNLTLSDVNDNEPYWTAGHGTVFDIQENVTDILLVDLDANDIDAGINSELVYFFVGGIQDLGPFHIDRTNGTLHLVGTLDYETIQSYSLSVVVADRNGEMDDDNQMSLSNTTTIIINIIDINDNLPYFNRCPHNFVIPETLAEDSIVGEEMIASIADEDTIQNPFYFYLVSEEDVECNEAFCIDVNTGQIKLDSEIDFETKPMYTFYVVVSDRPNLTPEEAYSSPTIDLCETVATQMNNITKVEVFLVDVNDQQPQFVADSLLAAVAEEAEFDTTVTVLKVIDGDDNETFSKVYYEIIAVESPYLVDRETGEVTTADTFTDRSGEVDRFTVVAYDNEGKEPSFTATAVLTVRVFKQCQQIIAVSNQPQEQAENCRLQLESAISNETGYIIYTTKIRVHQDEEINTVDTTRADMIFYALDRSTGEVVQPEEVISLIERAIDLQEDPVKSLVDDCEITNLRAFCTDSTTSSTDSNNAIIWAVTGSLTAIILGLLICLLCVCALERRKARKLRVKNKSHEQSSNFSQFSQVGTSNPMWMPPYEHWEEESTTTTANQSATDRENPLYESQELTIEMFQDDEDDLLSVASSQGNLSKIKPPRSSTPGAYDSVYDDYDPLADALGITAQPEDSKTSLI